MRVLVLGSGGREHALVWKLRQSPLAAKVYCAPGNAGIAQDATLEAANLADPAELAELAARLKIDLTVVGPEAPLVAGVVEEFQRRGMRIVGPAAAAAQLEGSKIFAKEFMQRHGIPTAAFAVCRNEAELEASVNRFGFPVVLKADGLAAGKGVVVAPDRQAAAETGRRMLSGQLVGEAGRKLIVERFLKGEEVSFIVLADGENFLPLAPTQDHKAAYDNDQGPNTGGMGAYCDDAILAGDVREHVLRQIVRPTLDGIRADGAAFQGFLYCGLMMTAEGPQVLEYNVRLGDPETQPLTMRLSSDLLPLLDRAATNKLAGASAEWRPGATVCVVATSKGYPGDYERGRLITGIERADARRGVKVFHAGTKTQNGNIVTAGGRVLGITAAGETLREAIDRAYGAIGVIHFEGMHYRRDIGHKGLARAANHQ